MIGFVVDNTTIWRMRPVSVWQIILQLVIAGFMMESRSLPHESLFSWAPGRQDGASGRMKTSIRFTLCKAVVCSVLSASLIHSEPPAKSTMQSMIGTWEGYMADSDGSKHGEIRLEISADKITAINPGGNRVMGAGTYQVSGAGKDLQQIDATGTEGQFAGRKYAGVISTDGKLMKWCSANDNPRSQRPDKLQTNRMAGQFLMVLEKKN